LTRTRFSIAAIVGTRRIFLHLAEEGDSHGHNRLGRNEPKSSNAILLRFTLVASGN